MNPEIMQAAAAERAAELRREADRERLIKEARRASDDSESSRSGRQRQASIGRARPRATEA